MAALEHPPGSAFLLAAVGSHAAARFAEHVAKLGLTPPETGLLRAIAADPGASQQALAARLGTPPSRLVGLLDGLDARGLVRRRRNPADRRLHCVTLTTEGEALLAEVAAAGARHDAALTEGLDGAERAQLRALLLRIAEHHGLTPGVHPGYRRLAGGDRRRDAETSAP